jgi:ABC-type transport system involved in multi-copper enzyme maturation permease subunit
MPIYEQSYKPWEPDYRVRGRWLAVATHELRVARTSPIYRRLFLLALLPFLICLFILVVTDLMTTNPSALLREVVRRVQYTNIDARFFKIYLMMTIPFVYVFCLLVGGGSICNDYRNNLLEVYFAKPLTRFEYFLGKLAAICYMPLCLTIGGSVLLFTLHLIMAPISAREFLSQNLWVAGMCVLFSFFVVVPSALLVMACSALSRSAGWASVMVCALIFLNSAGANMIAMIVRERNLMCLAYVRSVLHMADRMFGGFTRVTVSWQTVAIGFAALAIVCAAIVMRRIRAVDFSS